MKIIIDQEKCIGCNMCEDISEGAISIKFNKNGRTADLDPNSDLTDHAVISNIKLAVETCPMQAIKIEE